MQEKSGKSGDGQLDGGPQQFKSGKPYRVQQAPERLVRPVITEEAGGGRELARGFNLITSPAAMLCSPALNKYLMVLFPAAMLVYASSHPVSRLRVDMPVSFVLVSAHGDAADRAAAASVAQAYWNVAVERLQWRCGFGCSLPADPPDDFRIDNELFGASLQSRAMYWSRLRKAWASADSWRTEREWSTTGLTRPASRFMQWVSDYEHGILGS